jgi:DNA ligase-1
MPVSQSFTMLFHELIGYFERLERSSGRLRMYSLIGDLFRRATASEIAIVAYLCEGGLLPPWAGLETGIGEQMAIQAISAAAGQSVAQVRQRYRKSGDLGIVVEQMLPPLRDTTLTVAGVYKEMREIARTAGGGSVTKKLGLLAGLLRRCSPREARYVLRFVTGKLRLGVGPLTILEGVARSFPKSKGTRQQLESAYNLCSDLGLVLKTARLGGLTALKRFKTRIGTPVRAMMAERLPSAEAIIEKLGTCSVESKLDGFRCQIHVSKSRVEIFSRNLERTTSMFPDLVESARKQLAGSRAILDGEAVAVNRSTGEFCPFQVTVQRKRKYRVAEMAREFPLRLFAFDLLHLNGRDYTAQPYEKRRKALETLLRRRGRLTPVERIVARTPAQLQHFFDNQIERGLEGIIAKRLDAPYAAGARNFNWIKLKQTYAGKLGDTRLYDAIDAVVVGYMRGRGTRARLGIGAVLVAAYDAKTDSFPTVAKVGSGLSEEEWVKLRHALDACKLTSKPPRVRSRITPDVWTEPKYVVTVLADQITRSPVHACALAKDGFGLALRFPRFIGGIRDDKSAEQATTVREIEELYAMGARTGKSARRR